MLLNETRDCIAAFDDVVARSSTAQDVIEAMTSRYPDRALPNILDLAANAACPAACREQLSAPQLG